MNQNLRKLSCAGKEFVKIFFNLKNLFLAFGVAFLFLIILVTAPNIQSIKTAIFNGESNLLFNFFNAVYLHLIGFRSFSIVTTILIALLFGFNLIAFKSIRTNGGIDRKTATTTTGGLIFSLLGAGCGACGILAVSFLSFFGMGALVSALPLGGAEFDIAGVILLFISLILILSQSITKNNCKI